SVVIVDDDIPTLTLTFSPASISEGAGIAASTLTIRRARATDAPLRIKLTGGDPSEVQFPAEVIIPAGLDSVTVPINAIDDGIVDGPQAVTIVAFAVYTSCGCRIASSEVGGQLVVRDDDGPSL